MELFTDNLIQEKSLIDIFGFKVAEDDVYASNFGQQTIGQELIAPRIIRGIMEGGSFRTSDSGARIDIFPAYNPTIGMVIYDDAANEIFKILIGGSNVGDIVIGRYSLGNALKWDKSASSIFFVSDTLDTESKNILQDFTFSPDNYSGAFKAGDITWNTTTGAITGGSGIIIYKNGIVGAADGVATFTLDATTGNATFAGTLSAASGTLGTVTAGSFSGISIEIIGEGPTTFFAVDETGLKNLRTATGCDAWIQLETDGPMTLTGVGTDVFPTYIKLTGARQDYVGYFYRNLVNANYPVMYLGGGASEDEDTLLELNQDGTGSALRIRSQSTPANPVEGDIYADTDHNPYFYNGIIWKAMIDAGDRDYGDGYDGDVTISSNTTLTSDKYYNSLTVNSGKVLNTGGYRVFVKGTLTNNGTIHRNGNDASGSTAGAALAAGTLPGSLAGKTGGAGGSSINNGEAGTAGTAQSNALHSTNPDGTDGGAGGDGGNGGIFGYGYGGGGASGGTGTASTIIPRTSLLALLMIDFTNIASLAKYTNGGSSASAGGGGGGDTSNGSYPGGAGGAGGGSGSNGGFVVICAKKIINNGVISANGGKGGNGANGSSLSTYPFVARGGGGGGGAGGAGRGGIVAIICDNYSGDNPTVTAGTAGTPGSAGTGWIGDGSTPGNNGQPGNAAEPSEDGLLIMITN